MRTNAVRVSETPYGQVVCQGTVLAFAQPVQVEPVAEVRDPLTTGVLIIHDEHLRDQLEAVLGFCPYAFGR
jgi:hypothetical protein